MRPRSARLGVAALAAIIALSGCGNDQAGPYEEESMGEPPPATTASGGSGACASPDFAPETPDDIVTDALPIRDLSIITASGEDVNLEVEVADDSREMAQGLMFRESLAEGCGMLFAYPSERDLSFWMRDTLIPLSIAYINSEGEIIDIQDMEALDDEPPNYASAEPAQYALEANVGFFEENGVELGDTISISSE